MNWKIPLFKIYWDEEDVKSVAEAIKVGMNATGVTVGENSIIGAFSFVNRDIPDNTVAVGVPAKVIKRINIKDKYYE